MFRRAAVRKARTLSLRGLMVLVLIVGGGMGWVAERAHSRRRDVEAITAAKGTPYFDFRYRAGVFIPSGTSWVPKWLARYVGTEFFHDVTRVVRLEGTRSDLDAARRAWQAIGRFHRLESLVAVDPPPGTTLSGLDRLSQLRVTMNGPATNSPIRLRSLPALREIFLNGPGVTDEVVRELAHLTSLREIRLETTNVTDAGLAHLSGLRELECLWVDHAFVTDEGLSHLASLPKLEILDLNGNSGVTDLGMKILSKNAPGLTNLMVGETGVTDVGLAELKGLPRLDGVQAEGQGAKLTDVGVASLSTIPGLEVLNLRGSALTDDGIARLKALKKLRWLQVSDTAITDEGVAMLGEIPTLRWLNLNGTEVTDAGLSSVMNLTSLEHLYLDGTAITDVGLFRLAKLRFLKLLTLNGIQASPEAVADLKGFLPPTTRIQAGNPIAAKKFMKKTPAVSPSPPKS
ncbi:leucine-rich repeat domain-containing protein [Singulisphaera rosea]